MAYLYGNKPQRKTGLTKSKSGLTLADLLKAIEADPEFRKVLKEALFTGAVREVGFISKARVKADVEAEMTPFLDEASARLGRVEEIMRKGASRTLRKSDGLEGARAEALKRAAEFERTAQDFQHDIAHRDALLKMAAEERERAERLT